MTDHFTKVSFSTRVVDSNRKLFIALKIEKLFGLLFACTDVTNTYVTPLDKLEDIADMIQRHEQGVIFLPTFQPYIIYQDRTERVIGQRRYSDFD